MFLPIAGEKSLLDKIPLFLPPLGLVFCILGLLFPDIKGLAIGVKLGVHWLKTVAFIFILMTFPSGSVVIEP
jgi:hypothetical protein